MNKPTTLINRTVRHAPNRTSVRLEPEFWTALDGIAQDLRWTRNELCECIQHKYPNRPYASAIRVFVMLYYKGYNGQ